MFRFHEAMQSMYHRHIEATLCVCIAKTQVTQFRNFPNISTTTGDREDPIRVPEVGLWSSTETFGVSFMGKQKKPLKIHHFTDMFLPIKLQFLPTSTYLTKIVVTGLLKTGIIELAELPNVTKMLMYKIWVYLIGALVHIS